MIFFVFACFGRVLFFGKFLDEDGGVYRPNFDTFRNSVLTIFQVCLFVCVGRFVCWFGCFILFIVFLLLLLLFLNYQIVFNRSAAI